MKNLMALVCMNEVSHFKQKQNCLDLRVPEIQGSIDFRQYDSEFLT